MSLGLGVFASVVLILAVYNKGFRKVVLWSGAATAVLALSVIGYRQYTSWQQNRAEEKAAAADEKVAAAHRQAVKDCVARFKNADIFDQVACEEHPNSVPIPPGATIGKAESRFTIVDPTPKKAHVIGATVTCDVVVYDRDKYATGDPEAIDSLHTGDAVEYVGHTTVSDEDIIRVHARKGYVKGCVEVKP